MSFLQLPEKLTYTIGQEIEIKFTGEYPSLFYIKSSTVNNIFGLSNDVFAVENGLIYKGQATVTGIVKIDVEQVWGADIDPDKEYICEITIDEVIEEIVINRISTEEYVQPYQIISNTITHRPAAFEGFLAKSLKKNFDYSNNAVDIVIKSEIAQSIRLKTSEGVLNTDTLTFKNTSALPSIRLNFESNIKRGLIYGLRFSYLDNVVTFMLPAGVVLTDENWRNELIGQLQILEEFEQLECTWEWDNNCLCGTSTDNYYGYKAEWLTSPDISLSNSYFSAPESDDTQIITLSLDADDSWLVKTIQLELESQYTAKNQLLTVKLFNTGRVINITPDTTSIQIKTKAKIVFDLVSELEHDYSGEFLVLSDTIKNWSDIRLNKSKLFIKAGEISDFIEIQSLNKNIGDFKLIFKPNHKNAQNTQFSFSVTNDVPVLKEVSGDCGYTFTTIYKRETAYISIQANIPVTKTEVLDIIIGTEVFKKIVEPGTKAIMLSYRMIVDGIRELKIGIKSKVYNVDVYNDIMPDKILYVGGKWKFIKSAPIDLIIVDNNGLSYQINEGQLWLPEFNDTVNKITVYTSKNQVVFSHHIAVANIMQPVIQMRVVKDNVIIETNFIVSQPLNYEVTINGDIIYGVIAPGEKNSIIQLAPGLNKIVFTDNTITTFIN